MMRKIRLDASRGIWDLEFGICGEMLRGSSTLMGKGEKCGILESSVFKRMEVLT